MLAGERILLPGVAGDGDLRVRERSRAACSIAPKAMLRSTGRAPSGSALHEKRHLGSAYVYRELEARHQDGERRQLRALTARVPVGTSAFASAAILMAAKASATLEHPMRVGSVVIDCNDFHTMAEFWQQALRYVPREPPEKDWVVLADPDGHGVNVSIQQVPEPRRGKNRLHLDLYTEAWEAEVERLVMLGARPHVRTPEPDEDFVVLEDPEGNLFCVVDIGPVS